MRRSQNVSTHVPISISVCLMRWMNWFALYIVSSATQRFLVIAYLCTCILISIHIYYDLIASDRGQEKNEVHICNIWQWTTTILLACYHRSIVVQRTYSSNVCGSQHHNCHSSWWLRWETPLIDSTYLYHNNITTYYSRYYSIPNSNPYIHTCIYNGTNILCT